MTAEEAKLARIAALADGAGAWDGDMYSSDVRAVLAESGPAAGCITLTPEEAQGVADLIDLGRDVLMDHRTGPLLRALRDRLEAAQ